MKFENEILKKYAAGERDFRDANLEGAYLINSNLEAANLEAANIRFANLKGANLEGANLMFAKLEGANLKGANLKGANLRGSRLSDADLSGADLSGAQFYSLQLGENVKNTFFPATTVSRNTCFLSDETKIVVICGCFVGLLSEAQQMVNSKPDGCKRKEAYITMIKKFLTD